MEKKNLKTINLQGKNYVQVNTRLEYFNETYPNGIIETSYEKVAENQYIFRATITPDIEKPARYFRGHSHGEVSRDKALEKLETVAVGRALAFMGIGIVESIASADEIEKFMSDPVAAVTANVKPLPDFFENRDPQEVPLCKECGSMTTFKEGVSKTGKKYKGYFCTVDKKHSPIWL